MQETRLDSISLTISLKEERLSNYCEMRQDSSNIFDSQAILMQLAKYPVLHAALRPYVEWAIVRTQGNGVHHKVIRALINNDHQALEKLDQLFAKAQMILGINTDQFSRTFGFHNDLLIDDPEKIHDVIAEPLLAVKLVEHGFAEIKRLPKSITVNDTQLPLADFTAERGGLKFAVELKTIRTERTIVAGAPSVNALEPDWWGEMFLNNARTKIEDKHRRVIKQLMNTCGQFECKVSMLVLYSRRLGVSALSEPYEYGEKLEVLKEEYPQIEFLGCMDYYGTFAIVP